MIAQEAGPAVAARRTAEYVRQEVESLRPAQVTMKLYDLAIAGCRHEDCEKASGALVELIAALDFEYQEVALGLFRLYEYCMRMVKSGRFDRALPILSGLREAWEHVVADERRRRAACGVA